MSLWPPVPTPENPLARYRKLPPLAGVPVSPFCLGGMTIGDKWGSYGYGHTDNESNFKILNAFFDAGGNFIDTANNYQDETSEMFIGEWMEQRGVREQVVMATKYTAPFKRHDITEIKQRVLYAGNHIKSLHTSLEASLQKLRTTYVDILYVHFWDFHTGIEEVMNALHNLVLQGKVLYLLGKTPFVIYQGSWNVLDRDMERDIIPMCRAEGLAIAPWNILRTGHIRTDAEEEQRRQSGEKGRVTWRGNWERSEDEKKVCKALEEVAQTVGAKHITAVAIIYLMQKVPYVFPIVGMRKIDHLEANLEALEIALSPQDIEYIEGVVPFNPGFPHNIIGDGTVRMPVLHSTGFFEPESVLQAIRPPEKITQ